MSGGLAAGRMQMKPPKDFTEIGRADPATDERLAPGGWLPPQGRPGGVDGAIAYGSRNTCYAAGTGFGRRIVGFRGLCDMSLARLAAQMNMAEEALAAWEGGQLKGPGAPTVLDMCNLCDAFMTTPNSLIMGPYFVQPGPLDGLGQHLETLPSEAQLAILHIARICRRIDGKEPPSSPYT